MTYASFTACSTDPIKAIAMARLAGNDPLKEARLTVFADFGYGVLDTAMVETAAYCLERVD